MSQTCSSPKSENGKKNYSMPKCTPIYTNHINPRKIIDGWQAIKGDFSRFNQLLPKMQL